MKKRKNSAEGIRGSGLVRASLDLPFFTGLYVLWGTIPDGPQIPSHRV